jgi:eukaryotic-like serine/threonine-protein kinase
MPDPIKLGRYSLFAKLASGGMATVYLGRMSSEVGFGRTVAIKRLHPHLASEPEFVSMFLDEARLAARIHHPNVVQTIDVVTTDGELFLVMDYVRGESLGGLLKQVCMGEGTIPIPVVATCAVGFLSGLHAAHEAKDEQGKPLAIVHRDISPQNVFVGADGVTRVLDFGVAKAASRLQTTKDGQLKGKLAYMPPEQILGKVSRQTDIYSAGVVLWEALACRRLFVADNEGELVQKVMDPVVSPPSKYNKAVPAELDRVVLRALAKEPSDRYATAETMAEDIDAAVRPASAQKVAEWVKATSGDKLAARAELVAQIESGSAPRGEVDVEKLLSNLPSLEASAPGSVVPAASDPSAVGATVTATSPTNASVAREARLTVPPSRPVPVMALGVVAAVAIAAACFMAMRPGPSREKAAARASVASIEVTSVLSPAGAAMDPASVSSGAPATAVDSGSAVAPVATQPSRSSHNPQPPIAATPRASASAKAHDISSLIDTR